VPPVGDPGAVLSIRLWTAPFGMLECLPTGAMMTWCTSAASRIGLPRVASGEQALVVGIQLNPGEITQSSAARCPTGNALSSSDMQS
jgi:hypothetical protein